MKETFHEGVSKITVTLMPHKTGRGVLKPPEKATGCASYLWRARIKVSALTGGRVGHDKLT